ncbi:hypothetical protein TUMSATVNIG1_60850 (plasmid) [Vibrio nigripulchritudo]|nr:hypothetical protein VNTUMSATTG_60380 [Vibrio nigripulchritudo]BDU35476.1 hypothetical protein TUMSATVNIG1_60850 [Vibrio nigripulchritudo]
MWARVTSAKMSERTDTKDKEVLNRLIARFQNQASEDHSEEIANELSENDRLENDGPELKL